MVSFVTVTRFRNGNCLQHGGIPLSSWILWQLDDRDFCVPFKLPNVEFSTLSGTYFKP